MDRLQQHHDAFYWRNGKCCAGCDWWRGISANAGACTRSAPVSGEQRMGMLGIESCSLPVPAGHVVTKREHVCGEFKDDFDWSSLPLTYRKTVGAPI